MKNTLVDDDDGDDVTTTAKRERVDCRVLNSRNGHRGNECRSVAQED